MACARKVLCTLLRRGKPNETFDKPSVVAQPSSRVMMRIVSSVCAAAEGAALTGIEMQSKTTDSFGIPCSSHMRRIFSALRTRSIARSGISLSAHMPITAQP